MIIIEKFNIIKKLKISVFAIILFIVLSNFSYATDIEAETMANEIEEASYSSTVSEKLLEIKGNSLISEILDNSKLTLQTVGVVNSSSYDLRDYYDIEVKNQGTTYSCWAFSLLSSTEINMQINLGLSVNLSEAHMNYATSESFYDGVNEYAFNREASSGGSTIIGLAYLTNGQGVVLEEEMPFTDDTSYISLDEIDIDNSYYVTGYSTLPTIYKIDSDGETLYTDGYGTYYDDDEVDALRDVIKEHIVEYGGISAYMAASASEYYSSSDIVSSVAYYCDNMDYEVDHAVTIIGWDDNYSKDNFTGSATPSKDGAYIVLNSYGEDCFDDGYIYVSYEDVWIETMLYGITSTSEVDYDNLYQHDEFGANVPLTLTANGSNFEEGYYASIYSRDTSDTEYISQISITCNQYATFDIYVNPDGDDLSTDSLVLVSETGVLSPGYNTITFDEVELTGEEFAVVVKQTAIDETYYFMIEAQIDDTLYANTTADVGDSKVSLDGVNWYNLADLGTITYSGYSVDLSEADVCIKAFTTVSSASTNSYIISDDNYITGIYHNTTISSFLNNMSTTDDYQIIDKNGNTVTDYTSLVTTNMQLIVDDETYYLVVRGDLNGDGKLTVTDLSKHALHYVGYTGHILTGAYEKATDINLDGKLTITDLSQLRLLFVNGTL